MSPQISIIIPCFNRVTLLKDTLRSVEVAIIALFAEIILVDDGSETPIEEEMKEFEHLKIKFIRQKNSGLTTSRYNGLMSATGNFVQFLDSDDQIDKDKFTIQIQAMIESNADVSHTDVLQVNIKQDKSILPASIITKFRDCQNPAEFYIDVQPAPHSPIFRREYLVETIKKAFIPLNREYDSIGEIWFYYNLAPYPCNIIKIDKPLTICIHHNEERLTNHWERLSLCALSIKINYLKNYPNNAPFIKDASMYVGKAAFNTYRGLPYDMYAPFQNAFITIWEKLEKNKKLNGGKYFKFLSRLIGHKLAAKFFKLLSKNKYDSIRTISNQELISNTLFILKQAQLTS